ncbi:MAG: hypothetical protein M0Z80_07560 [Treponema sp.]|nr:hypothetical protein [Treponema sp.]
MSELLRLELRSPLGYVRPPGAAKLNLDESWPLPPLAQGDDELYLFETDEIIRDDAENGPALVVPLPYALHVSAIPASDGSPVEYRETGASIPRDPGYFALPAGSYAFMQFLARDIEGLHEAMDDFVKECWWQRVPVSGPLYLRRVDEDGAAKLQLLRRSE